MEATLMSIYCAIALRTWIALRLNDFKPKYPLFIGNEVLKRKTRAIAQRSLFCMTFLWPVFLVIYPLPWIKGVILGKRSSLNKLRVKVEQGMEQFLSRG